LLVWQDNLNQTISQSHVGVGRRIMEADPNHLTA